MKVYKASLEARNQIWKAALQQPVSPHKKTIHTFHIGKREIPLPRSRIARMALGALFVIGGLAGFLPVLGVWMIPVGILILSVDLPLARRLKVWGARKWNSLRAKWKKR